MLQIFNKWTLSSQLGKILGVQIWRCSLWFFSNSWLIPFSFFFGELTNTVFKFLAGFFFFFFHICFTSSTRLGSKEIWQKWSSNRKIVYFIILFFASTRGIKFLYLGKEHHVDSKEWAMFWWGWGCKWKLWGAGEGKTEALPCWKDLIWMPYVLTTEPFSPWSMFPAAESEIETANISEYLSSIIPKLCF